MQEVDSDAEEDDSTTPEKYKMKDVLPEYVIHNKNNLGPDTSRWQIWEEPPQRRIEYENALLVYAIWILCRNKSKKNQIVPAFGGFISETGQPPKRRTTVDYFPMIAETFTKYSTHKEILEICISATREVKQDPPYPIITMDLGGIMKLMPVIWQEDRYEACIVLIGSFHTIMNDMKMIGKKMAGSGYDDLLIESGLTTPGGLNGVIKVSGSNYNKSLYILKMCE